MHTGPDPQMSLLIEHLSTWESALVAFSGGVDSTLLLAAAVDALGDRALAVTACSPSFPAAEQRQAVELAALIGARHRLLESREMDDPRYRANPPDRCAWCKAVIFQDLAALAEEEGLEVLLDGTNADDHADWRPGTAAAAEAGARSPLSELGLGKGDIRRLSRARGLPNWDQPACACLASRVPYGTEITRALLERIGRLEDVVKGLGFRVVRVRHHGELVRVEVDPSEVKSLAAPEPRAAVLEAARRAGYEYVCLDLEGYRTGSMNEVLPGRSRAG